MPEIATPGSECQSHAPARALSASAAETFASRLQAQHLAAERALELLSCGKTAAGAKVLEQVVTNLEGLARAARLTAGLAAVRRLCS
jgi:hypothetical protein